MMETEKIVFTTDDGEEILLYVIEQTRISGVNYLLVSESEDEEAECVILRDTSRLPTRSWKTMIRWPRWPVCSGNFWRTPT